MSTFCDFVPDDPSCQTEVPTGGDGDGDGDGGQDINLPDDGGLPDDMHDGDDHDDMHDMMDKMGRMDGGKWTWEDVDK